MHWLASVVERVGGGGSLFRSVRPLLLSAPALPHSHTSQCVSGVPVVGSSRVVSSADCSVCGALK